MCDSHFLSFLFSFFMSQSRLLICFLCSESGWEIKRRPIIVCLRAGALCFGEKRRLGCDRLHILKVAKKMPLSLEAIQVHFSERFHTCTNTIVPEFLTTCTCKHLILYEQTTKLEDFLLLHDVNDLSAACCLCYTCTQITPM